MRALFLLIFVHKIGVFLATVSSSGSDGDLPHPDEVICVAGEQGLRREIRVRSWEGVGWPPMWDLRT